jgi:hypothetical protein
MMEWRFTFWKFHATMNSQALLDRITRASLACEDAKRQTFQARVIYDELSAADERRSTQALDAMDALNHARDVEGTAKDELMAAERALAAADRKRLRASTFDVVR